MSINEANTIEENIEANAADNTEAKPVKVRSVRKKVVKAISVNTENISNNEENAISQEDNNIEYEEVQSIKRPQDIIYINKLSGLTFEELLEFANGYGVRRDTNVRRQELMHLILRAHLNSGGKIEAEGTLEVLPDGFGFLRSKNTNYLSGHDDIYIAPTQIRLFGLRTGDVVGGEVRPPKDNSPEKFFGLLRIERVNGDKPENLYKRPIFDKLTPIFPNERINLEFAPNKISTRIINLVSPIGKGQRGLIVSPPKAGKTMMLQEIANAICRNYPDIKLFILLIDERPEEVTDMKRNVPEAEVIASTFDEPPEKHCQVSEMVLEKAKRLVENKHDVVIILDSITRLSRAYNLTVPASGKILTGGVDSNALHKPKRFFGAARNIEDGGSLTIIASALVDTGSRMDDYIYEEFKGTGNMELHLDRKFANRRLFPAIDIDSSSTRRDDLLLSDEELAKMRLIRNAQSINGNVDEYGIIEKVIDKMSSTKNNFEFLKLLNS
ncbi:transcription termination factor Rho [Brachyspira aalborgi]|uniref:Transcription termination factor Rho n=1 Tax=Brachyspira aalborgi TaxID=29522 RepID=A0A5C8D7Q5_9SPIR|nr:transcription termination factor Rho [Brachyspira aalborgi]TXJ21479.1 transcription termination factor Rho [Brachyspira aalborgi]